MRVLVCGGRYYRDMERLREELDYLELTSKDVIVHGDAQGADRLAGLYAQESDVQCEPHPADWKTHGKSAGPIRNQAMLDSGIDCAVVFPGGAGTRDMMIRLFNAGVRFRFVGK